MRLTADFIGLMAYLALMRAWLLAPIDGDA